MATTGRDAFTTDGEVGALTGLGVTAAEERAFRVLLRAGSATTTELGRLLGDSPTASVRRLTARLVELGLALRLPGRPMRLIAAPPTPAIENLAARRLQEVNRSRMAAAVLVEEAQYGAEQRTGELLELVTGAEEVAQRFTTAHRVARHEVCALMLPPFTVPPQTPITHEEVAQRRGVVARGVYDPRALAVVGMTERMLRSVAAGEQARIGDVPLKLFIADRDHAILPLTVGGVVDSALIVRPSALLDALVELFEIIWRAAVPLADETRPQAYNQRERHILALMTAGAPDEAIARQLGISSRTVQRHIRSICDDLGAVTRFQAGLKVGRGALAQGVSPQPPR